MFKWCSKLIIYKLIIIIIILTIINFIYVALFKIKLQRASQEEKQKQDSRTT